VLTTYETLRDYLVSVSSQWEWPERHRQYMVFDPLHASGQLARLTIQSVNLDPALREAMNVVRRMQRADEA